MRQKYTVEYYSVMRKKDNPVICDNTHGPWAHYAKWSKSDRKVER